jgi:glycosyltransferase involved in cell wall biosynthesis
VTHKIKILRVVTQSEVVIWHLKNFIDRSENDYEVFIAGNNVSRYKNEYPNVVFFDIEILRKLSPLKDFVALVQLIVLCIKINPHITHSIMPKAGLLTSIAGFVTFVPVRIHTYTGQVWATMTGFTRQFYLFIDKLILKLNTQCLTDSQSQSNFLADNGMSNNGEPISYLGKGSLAGVSLNRFNIEIVKARNILRKELGIDENDFLFVFLARKSVIKGINELFESFAALAYLPDVKLLFIGPDESNGRLSELNSKYKDIIPQIISLDIVKQHEKYLAISDVLVLPSSSEGFGTIVIEAAALGIPSIGFKIVGLIDAIDDNNTGILVEPKNVNEFSAAMLRLYEDRKALNVLKINARSRVIKYFSADVIYKIQSDFYKGLLINKR